MKEEEDILIKQEQTSVKKKKKIGEQGREKTQRAVRKGNVRAIIKNQILII